jgi:hypothetical protein
MRHRHRAVRLAARPRPGPASACLERDRADFVVFYDLPENMGAPAHQQSHRVHLRGRAATHQRQQTLYGVRENALYLVFKLVLRLSLNWRAINAPNQLKLLLCGQHFHDGQLVLNGPSSGGTMNMASVVIAPPNSWTCKEVIRPI